MNETISFSNLFNYSFQNRPRFIKYTAINYILKFTFGHMRKYRLENGNWVGYEPEKKSRPYIGFSTWPQDSVELYRESIRETIHATETLSDRHCTRGQTIIAINGTALAIFITAIGLIDFLEWWVLFFVIPLLFSLIFAIYTFTIIPRRSHITDIWAAAKPQNQKIFTDTLLHREDYLNGLIRICDDIQEDSRKRGLFVAISGIIFFIALMILLIGISAMVWL